MNWIPLKFSTFLLCLVVPQLGAVPTDKDLRLTRSQKEILDKFKETVISKVPHDYMKEDIYLIRWLRAKKFNLKAAETLLMDDIKWRKQNRMDTIEHEDWSDMEEAYPWFVDGYDIYGKPIGTANWDEWDIRKGVLAGKLKKMMRWMTYGQETAVRRVRELQAQGKNVTQWHFIINMNNFNLHQHACAQCMPLYTNFISTYEHHYPGSSDKIMLLNTPETFEVVLNLMRPLMSEQTQEALKIYSNNRNEWEHIVFADIKKDQLVKEYGGTKIRY